MTDISEAVRISDIYQLGYVATDLDQAMEAFRTRHGVPAFRNLGEMRLMLDEGEEVRFRFALCFVGPLQLEIIQPLGGKDAIYREGLPAEGFGMKWHHIACKVASLDALSAITAHLQRGGHRIAMSGGNPEVAKFVYLDARATLGHYVEYLYLSPERLAFHATLPRY